LPRTPRETNKVEFTDCDGVSVGGFGGWVGEWVLVLSPKACKFIWQRYGDPRGGIINSSQDSNRIIEGFCVCTKAL
jgi:hypothetical protein